MIQKFSVEHNLFIVKLQSIHLIPPVFFASDAPLNYLIPLPAIPKISAHPHFKFLATGLSLSTHLEQLGYYDLGFYK